MLGNGPGPLVERGNTFQGPACGFQVGVEVNLRGLDVRVAEQSAMLAVSIPACRRLIAQVGRRVCGAYDIVGAAAILLLPVLGWA